MAFIEPVREHLASKQLHPKAEWLTALLSTARSNTPTPALKKSAEFKLLTSDITESLDKSRTACLPPLATDVRSKEQLLRVPVVVQVLDIEDVGRSRWSQIELIEQQERGEMTRGREIIRLAPDSINAATASTNASMGPYKLLLQDAQGTKIHAFELTPIIGIDSELAIGAKILIRQATIARGLLLLEAGNVEVLGGKIAAWAEAWMKERKVSLKSRIPASQATDNA